MSKQLLAGNNKPEAKKVERAVDTTFDIITRLHTQLEAVNAQLADLEAKLDAVLLPGQPEDAQVARAREEHVTPLETVLSEQSDVLHGINRRIDTLMRRVRL